MLRILFIIMLPTTGKKIYKNLISMCCTKRSKSNNLLSIPSVEHGVGEEFKLYKESLHSVRRLHRPSKCYSQVRQTSNLISNNFYCQSKLWFDDFSFHLKFRNIHSSSKYFYPSLENQITTTTPTEGNLNNPSTSVVNQTATSTTEGNLELNTATSLNQNSTNNMNPDNIIGQEHVDAMLQSLQEFQVNFFLSPEALARLKARAENIGVNLNQKDIEETYKEFLKV